MFISLALDRAETRSWITQHAIGATMPNLNTGILSAVPLVVPPDDLLREFSRLVAPIERLISARNEESLTLAELRDSLLPRLISGEIPISGVQRNQGA
jgi:type I restriction enzyme S subunit